MLHQLDSQLVHRIDGARSMQEWVRGRLDVSAHTARDLVDATRRLGPHPEPLDRRHGLSFERLVATLRLAATGADADTIRDSFGHDLAGVDRLRRRQRRITRFSERERYVDRFVWFQDSLDNTSGRLHGELPGFEYTIIRDAIEERAERFGDLPGPVQTSAQRRADALVAICQDSQDPIGIEGERRGGAEPLVTVFFDGNQARWNGELGAEIEFGPRVGPAVLDRILCEGRVQLVGLENGKPVVTSDTAKAIPPAVSRFVKHRDGGCTIAGCHSRYRLQVHHVQFRSDGGDHDPDNLTTSRFPIFCKAEVEPRRRRGTIMWSFTGWASGSTRTHHPTIAGSSAMWLVVLTSPDCQSPADAIELHQGAGGRYRSGRAAGAGGRRRQTRRNRYTS